ncbi:MAG: MBG domain-containing protein [Mucilaginibacter sp.]
MRTKFLLSLILLIITGTAIYAATPVITSFSPSSGPVGTLITVNGNNLANPTSVIVGGKAAIIVSSTATKLVVMVMPGAATGTESITTAGGKLTTSGHFKVTATPYPGKQQGAILQGTGSIGAGRQGSSVDISADGNTAIIGAENDNNGIGAAYIYTRKNGAWAQQGPKLVGTGAVGAARQGISVAISADGNMVIAGGNADNNYRGALWIFTRNNGVWSQQGAKLTPPANTSMGYTVDVSADGHTIVTGQPGSACVFIRSNSTWSTGFKLISTDITYTQEDANPEFGCAVAISADGKTTVVGARKFGKGHFWQGTACVFIRSGNTWAQQGPKLHATDAVYQAGLGSGVALSADGNTVVLGGWYEQNSLGAAWVFTRTGTTWAQKGPRLFAADADDQHMGASVAISADGNTVAAGGPSTEGASGVWIFTNKNDAWIRQSDYLTRATGNTTETSQAIALNATGNTLIAGLPNNFDMQGGVQVFTPLPPKQDQIITWSVPKTSFIYGDADFSYAITATSGLPVHIFSDTKTNPGVIDMVNNKMHINNAGTITFTAVQVGNDAYNAASPAKITITVNKAPLIARIGDVYAMQGNAMPQFSYTATGLVNDDKVIDNMYITTTATKDSPPGNYPITGWSLSNKYEVTVKPGRVTMLSPEFVNAPVNKTYGDPDFYVFGNNAPGVTIYNSSVLTTVKGKTRITAAGEANLFVSYQTNTITKITVVKKATLTITANNSTKVAGSPNPVLGVSYNGFVYADNKNSLTTQPTVTTTATLSSPPGTYPIIVSGAVSGNYQFSYVAGTLTVTNSSTGITKEPIVTKAISPNGDGINDVLTISGIENFADNKLSLMNSRGVKIYEAKNYGSEGKLFNGRSNITNALQKAGTYFYMLQYKDNGVVKDQKGYIVLKY